jgi:hypothetical protein
MTRVSQRAAACHFYQKMGCTLGAIDRFAYPGLPGEAQLLWSRALASDDVSALACRLPVETP